MNLFDICIITASNSKQASVFKKLLKRRIDHGLYPREIDFKVYHDPDKGRVGSGGGTLLALNNLLNDYRENDSLSFFSNKRILIIHAGGQSRRLPCYIPEGKIFAPIPVATSSIVPPVVLDMQLTLFLKYPWKRGEVIVISGDSIIDFDTTILSENRGAICGFAKPAPVEQGEQHGVFGFDTNKEKVLDFYQKAPKEELSKSAMLEGTNQCALDIGIVAFNPEVIDALIKFGFHRVTGSSTILNQVQQGKLKFDLYVEIMIACLKEITFKSFYNKIKNQTSLDQKTLTILYDNFKSFSLNGVLTKVTTFLHFGTLSEYPQSCLDLHYKGLRPFYTQENEEIESICTSEIVLFNGIDFNVPVGRHKTVYAESVKNCTLAGLEGGNLLVGVDSWHTDIIIPEGICIDQRRIGKKEFSLVYSIHDTFKPMSELSDIVFCGTRMSQWLENHGLIETDIRPTKNAYDLFNAKLFCSNVSSAYLSGYWQKNYNEDWSEEFKSKDRFSIKEINEMSDAWNRESGRIEIRKQVLVERLSLGTGWRNISVNDFVSVVRDTKLKTKLSSVCKKTDDLLLKPYRQTLINSIDNLDIKNVEKISFGIDYVQSKSEKLKPSIKQDQIVWARSPVRLDLAGGWSDTPPYTLRYGGQVTNLSVNLNGQPPIQIFCRRTNNNTIRIQSIDLGVAEEIKTFKQLMSYRDPSSPFGLPKAALVLLGVIPQNSTNSTLSGYFKKFKGGLEITLLCAVPKGSGLGTSSILGATILAALHRFFGRRVTHNELFMQVLQMEQMLTTGGGWQDQIGGIEGGAKYIESKPGLMPNPIIHRLDPWLFQEPQMHGCFTLFYTGITRLAKNILQEVVQQVNENKPAYQFTLNYMRELAVRAKNVIGLRDIKSLSEIINESWKSNIRIHPSTTNRSVNQLLESTKRYYQGVKLLGAGGGGYALFISESVSEAEKLKEMLRTKFENDKARIVDFSLNEDGLQVTVS